LKTGIINNSTLRKKYSNHTSSNGNNKMKVYVLCKGVAKGGGTRPAPLLPPNRNVASHY